MQDDLTEIYSLSYSLRKSGWEPTYPYVRVYYQKVSDQGVVASAAFTVYERRGKLECFGGVSPLHDLLKKLVEKNDSIISIKKVFPKKFAEWKLREVVIGHSLVSDFEVK